MQSVNAEPGKGPVMGWIVHQGWAPCNTEIIQIYQLYLRVALYMTSLTNQKDPHAEATPRGPACQIKPQ